MRLTLRIGFVAIATLAASTAGCERPREIVPVAPPGLDLQRIPPTAPGEGAQALGEQPAATPKKPEVAQADSPPTPIGQPRTTPSGLIYETLKEGTGPSAKSGQAVKIHYSGTFPDGKPFDSSRGKDPLPVVIGTREVIAGWDEGVPGMKVGEIRKLTIPPAIAYGTSGREGIPPNSTLIFEVELMEAKE